MTEVEDIAYIDDGNVYHKLDVMYPDNLKSGEKLPVIIDIHGGGWMYANKDLNDNYCLSLADRGYVVFNISYRLVPDVTVNEQIQDVAYALKWIGENMKTIHATRQILCLPVTRQAVSSLHIRLLSCKARNFKEHLIPLTQNRNYNAFAHLAGRIYENGRRVQPLHKTNVGHRL